MSYDRPPRRFRLTLTQGMALAMVAGVALAGAFALRFGLVEPRDMTLYCDAGAPGLPCLVRRVTVGIFLWFGFGLTALAAALLALLRPSFLLLTTAVVAGAFGLVLYNTTLSAVAISLLPLLFARPRPEPDFAPE